MAEVAEVAEVGEVEVGFNDEPIVGEYSTNMVYADLKVTKTPIGKYKLSVKDSEKEDWKEVADLRPAVSFPVNATFEN